MTAAKVFAGISGVVIARVLVVWLWPWAMFGSVSGCALDIGFVVAIAYHLDNQTHGGTPSAGNDCLIGIPMGFSFPASH